MRRAARNFTSDQKANTVNQIEMNIKSTMKIGETAYRKIIIYIKPRGAKFITQLLVLFLASLTIGCDGEMRPITHFEQESSLAASAIDTSTGYSSDNIPRGTIGTEPEFVPTEPADRFSNCVSRPGLICVNTALPDQVFTQTKFTPQPTDILAFKFKTAASKPHSGYVAVARISISPSSKLVVISSVPGDVDISNKLRGCYAYGVEATLVRYVTNYPTANPLVYCHLEPGHTYYFNISSRTYSSHVPTCSSSTTCGFTLQAN